MDASLLMTLILLVPIFISAIFSFKELKLYNKELKKKKMEESKCANI